MSTNPDHGVPPPQGLAPQGEPTTEARRAIAAFAAKIGNELNNPLAAIQAAHEFVKRRASAPGPNAIDATVTTMLGVIDIELENARRLVADLVDLSSERPVMRTSFMVQDLIGETEREVRRPANVAFVNEASDELRPVSADRDRLARALRRLVRNAVEAIPLARPGIVRVRADLKGDALVIEVSDNGEGIDPANLTRIGEPLFGTKVKGAGLGVTIASALVAEEGGSLHWTSELGAGSTFTISVPNV